MLIDAGAAAASSSSSGPFNRHRPLTMKPLFAALLAGLLCMQTAMSLLICFTCDKVDHNNKCTDLQVCDDTDGYCYTKYFGRGSGEDHKELISKGCSAECPEVGFDIGVMAFSKKCCQHSFCNTSGAVSVQKSSLLLLVGTLASVFYIIGVNL